MQQLQPLIHWILELMQQLSHPMYMNLVLVYALTSKLQNFTLVLLSLINKMLKLLGSIF